MPTFPDDAARQDQAESHPPLLCWFCEQSYPLGILLRDSILIARDEREGGPYYLFHCPFCLKDNRIEESRRGRWFSSPNVKVGFLDFLFNWGGGAGRDGGSEALLKAIAWLRENEDRRRYFFERDGDSRYSGTSFLRRLWPWASGRPLEAEPRRGAGAARPSRAGGDASGAAGAGGSRGEREDAGADSRPRSPRLLSPHEILGVPPGASLEVVKQRFHALAVKYHPDKVHHLGEEFQKEAHRRFIELQKAYEALCQRR